MLKHIKDGVGDHKWTGVETLLSDWKFEDYENNCPQKGATGSPVRGSDTGTQMAEEDSLNFVGALSEFTVKEKAEGVVGPEFKDLDCKVISPTERLFEVECNLYFVSENGERRHLLTRGSGTTKKSAKRKSAAEMVHLLQSEGKDIIVRPITYHKPGDDDSPVSPPVVHEMDTNTDPGCEWIDCDYVPESDATVEPEDKQVTESVMRPEVDFFSELKELVTKMKMQMKVDDVSTDSSSSYTCIISASTAGDSESVSADTKQVACGESSSSFEEAKQNAARNLLKIFDQKW